MSYIEELFKLSSINNLISKDNTMYIMKLLKLNNIKLNKDNYTYDELLDIIHDNTQQKYKYIDVYRHLEKKTNKDIASLIMKKINNKKQKYITQSEINNLTFI